MKRVGGGERRKSVVNALSLPPQLLEALSNVRGREGVEATRIR